jgi:[acyl-carrier-protein] S-malonyltransferase
MRALLFPGQGSQYVGMAKDLATQFPAVAQLYAEADAALGFALSKVCFEGPDTELVQTSRTQPAIFLHSVALWTAWAQDRPSFQYVAGHSLGEFTALTVAGAWDFATGLSLVKIRSAAMQKACTATPGTMAAILNLPPEKLEPLVAEACSAGIVQAANFNSPGQVALSGERAAVERAVALAPDFGARRATLLPVGGAFHSPLMAGAAEELKAALAAAEIRAPRVPVVLNVTGAPTRNPDEIRTRLAEQLTAPVRWQQSLEALHRAGVTEFVEIGPGRVLQGLVKRTLAGAATWGVDSADDLRQAQSPHTGRS